jgi:hypothetical protein
MGICKSCGGVIGIDCFNPSECEWISEQQEKLKQQNVGGCSRCEHIHHLDIEHRRRVAAEAYANQLDLYHGRECTWDDVLKALDAWQSIIKEAGE